MEPKIFLNEILRITKKLQPLIGLFVLMFIIFSSVNLYKYVQLQDQIKENCGWEKESVRCFCERSDVIKMENELKEGFPILNFTDEKYGS